MRSAGRLSECVALLSGNLWFKRTWLLIPPPQLQLDGFYGYCTLIVVSLEAWRVPPSDWKVMCPADQWTLVFCCSWRSVYCISNCTGALSRREPCRRNCRGGRLRGARRGQQYRWNTGRIEKRNGGMWRTWSRHEIWSVRAKTKKTTAML